MDVRRAVGWLGQAMISLGVLILLFVAYQLWGTGLHEARSQDQLKDQFEQALGDEIDPGTIPPPPPEGDAVAILKIPKIDVEKAVVEGVTVADLKKGPGHYPDTPLPGQPGNAAIAGHRTTYGAPFYNLEEMEPGDPLLVTTRQGQFEYRVTEVKIVSPSAVEVLDPSEDNRLTLTTCHPRFSAAQRMILVAHLEGEAAPAPPPRQRGPRPAVIDEGLSGDPAARAPAIAWGAVVAALWLVLWWLGRLWRRWPVYLLGVVPAAVVLFLFFENFARLLPANY